MNHEQLSHLHASYRAYALLSPSERIQWIRQDRWIHYSRAEQVLNRLSDLLTYPARDRMPCLLLFGPAKFLRVPEDKVKAHELARQFPMALTAGRPPNRRWARQSSAQAFVEKHRILIQYLTTPTDDRVPPFFRIVDADPHWRHYLFGRGGLSAKRRTLFTHANLVFVTFVSLC